MSVSLYAEQRIGEMFSPIFSKAVTLPQGRQLYKFLWNTRYGRLDGLFLANEEDVQAAIGKQLYFGEVLGKFSEVSGTFEEEDVTRLDVSTPEAIAFALCKGGIATYSTEGSVTLSGYNPLNYIEEGQE